MNIVRRSGGAGKPYIWMALACLIWLVGFGDYFTGKSRLSSDAVSYFEHTSYFIENIKHGVFPLWDSGWSFGSPNDFFLRRIGCFNPIYLWMALLSALGVSHSVAYLAVLSFYFFLGAFGFFLLARLLYKDERVAFCAFLLFLFSNIGGRIFDSYMCLVIVPTVWFFYFSLAFLQGPRRTFLAGACLGFIIAINTYIPLFFLTILFAVIFFGGIFFLPEALASGRNVILFLRRHFLFCLLMGGLVLVAFVPPVMFFLDSQKVGIVMPERHGRVEAQPADAAQTQNVLKVDTKLISWGIMEELFFTGYFSDLRRFLLALVYVPLLAVLLWIWGGFFRINRRLLLFFSVGIFFLLLGTPMAAPVYAFLYEHVFYFKYIRNLHFFLWFILLPLVLLVSVEFMAQILAARWETSRRKFYAALVALSGGVVMLALTIWLGNGIAMTFFVIGAALVFSLAYIFRRDDFKGPALFAGLLIVIAPQAVEVFHYLCRNASADAVYGNIALPAFRYVREDVTPDAVDRECHSLYYSTAYLQDLCRAVTPPAMAGTLKHVLVAYGRVEPMRYTPEGMARMDQALTRGEDVVFATGLEKVLPLSSQEMPLRFTKDSAALSVEYWDTNTLSLRTDFNADKFLVYADGFSRGWRAFVDGKAARVFTANLASKGIFVPAGERRVEFRYGGRAVYVFNILMMGIFNILFYGVAFSLGRMHQGGDRS